MPPRYRIDQWLEGRISQVRNSNLNVRVKEVLLDFISYQAAQRKSAHYQYKSLGLLKDYAIILGSNFLNPTRSQIQDALAQIERRGCRQWTVQDYRAMQKRFYKLLLGRMEG